MNRLFLLLAFSMIVGCDRSVDDLKALELVHCVDPFIGTDGPGNTYPGAVAPFGMVQLSPDNGLPGWDRIAGYYWQDSTIAGFSHTHLTGTGAGDLYDILMMPVNSRFSGDLWPEREDERRYSKFSHENEEAHAGYYKVLLESYGITAELTATERVGMHRYTFPEDEQSAIILDLGYSLNWDSPLETYIEIEDSVTISGFRKSTGWAKDQRVYFVAKFSKAFETMEFEAYSKKGERQRRIVEEGCVLARKTKVSAGFKTEEKEQILVKVALSSASIEGARENMETEAPGWDFDLIRKETERVWEEYLSKIIIDGSATQKRIFYTNLYHTFLNPSLHSDVSGAFKAADGSIKEAKDYTRYHTFSLWDTYRATHPLYTILTPDHVEDFISGFLAHYDETGLLPVWELCGNETNMMIGYHSIPVIVDAYVKGIEFDYDKAFEACKLTMMAAGVGLDEYMEYGYFPADGGDEGHWSVSKTMEYAYDDWCVAQFALALGKDDDYKYFMKRADNWKHHYDEESGFFRPRRKDGSFVDAFVPREYTEYYCESNAWQYFWHVQHDIDGLMELVGKERYAARLDSMFSFYPLKDDKLPIFSTGMIGQYAHGNEPVHHVAYLYNLLEQPERTQELVHQITETLYTDQPNGYCGNEDCGQMSAWYVFSTLGLYPVNPAEGRYFVGAPKYENAEIHLENGKEFRISTEGFEVGGIVERVMLNGEDIGVARLIEHEDIMKGGEIVFYYR